MGDAAVVMVVVCFLMACVVLVVLWSATSLANAGNEDAASGESDE